MWKALSLLTVVAALLVFSNPAMGHDRLGRAQPRVETTVKGSGLMRVIAFRVRDIDSGNTIPDATLGVTASSGSGDRVAGAVTRLQPDLFRCTLALREDGHWRIEVRIGGRGVAPTSFSFDLDIAGVSRVDDRPSSGGPSTTLLVAAPLAAAALLVVAAVVVVRRRRARRLGY